MPGSLAPIATLPVPELRDRFNFDGRIIGPGDGGYDHARTIFYGGFDRRPAAIVRPLDAAGAAQVIRVARDNGLELAVRGGGHSRPGTASATAASSSTWAG